MGRVDRITFNGIVFRRYPDAPGLSEQRYYTPSGNHRRRGIGRLHEEIWKASHGPIPPGWHIHHKDEDTLNNSLDNLEAIPGDEHLRHHAVPGVWPEPLQTHHEEALRKAAEWHRSPEGRAWHVEHGKRTWEGRQPALRICQHCGTEFGDMSGHGQFCSNNCKTKARRASRVDDEQRICEGCGETFTVNRYAKTRCCSRRCAWVVRRRG